MKILLVEDDANLREVTQRSLEKERYVEMCIRDSNQIIFDVLSNALHASRILKMSASYQDSLRSMLTVSYTHRHRSRKTWKSWSALRTLRMCGR